MEELTEANLVAISKDNSVSDMNKDNSVSDLKTETNQSVKKSSFTDDQIEHADTVPVEDLSRYGPKN